MVINHILLRLEAKPCHKILLIRMKRQMGEIIQMPINKNEIGNLTRLLTVVLDLSDEENDEFDIEY